ncbi:sigma-54-dependent transcriptional regulator [Candidatus Thiosymbion oneisti]|uniref:sigma-54-dependent transcriptional regulator n=1 Tax=Candidatus Thiosymbion oneisti TaxID=589554 RepID=UPI000B7DDD72|nr:sigma 54-interacting transcriptional regulator [Candidatus Thiosymbion oneisti]
MNIPRILVLDDLFGRNVPEGRNADRENLCAHFLWQDATGDAAAKASRQRVLKPTAEAVFARGQTPIVSPVGATVENDLDGSLAAVREGWTHALTQGKPPWAMLLLDLCFYTGRVTEESHRRTPGMPEGRPGDDDPRGYFGLTLLDAIHREFPELPIFILSSKPREEVSLEFSRRGALGFIARDDLQGPERLAAALWQHGLLPDPAGEVVGNSLPVLLALREARRAVRHRGNLLIRGERGSGKELLASYAHRVSVDAEGRADLPLVTVNSAVLRTDLFASELFGIEPKTASGVAGKIGLVEAADGGDLFLDEIADMPPEAQATVLRVLQERRVTRIGARRSQAVDVRFLAATNADLEGDPRRIRADLLDRLRLGGTLWLPPLRARKTDIPLLTERFVREAEARHAGTRRREITPEAMDRLLDQEWPGNIRELRTCLFDAVSRHADVEYLVPSHLRIGAESAGALPARPRAQPAERTENVPSARAVVNLSTLLAMHDAVRFDPADIAAWSGCLPDMQQAHAWLLARCLHAALDATRRRTPEHPEGVLQIHPAVKLIIGDTGLSASKAADVVKRLLRPLEDELEGELREALNIALRLRPRSPKAAGTRR